MGLPTRLVIKGLLPSLLPELTTIYQDMVNKVQGNSVLDQENMLWETILMILEIFHKLRKFQHFKAKELFSL